MIRPTVDDSQNSGLVDDYSDNDCSDNGIGTVPQNHRIPALPVPSIRSSCQKSSEGLSKGSLQSGFRGIFSGFSKKSKEARSNEGSRIAKRHPWEMKGVEPVHGARDKANSSLHTGNSTATSEVFLPALIAPGTKYHVDSSQRQTTTFRSVAQSFYAVTDGPIRRRLSNPDIPYLPNNFKFTFKTENNPTRRSSDDGLYTTHKHAVSGTENRSFFDNFADYMLGPVEGTTNHQKEEKFYRTSGNKLDLNTGYILPDSKERNTSPRLVTLASLFRLKEEEVTETIHDVIIKDIIESTRKNQKFAYKTSFEIDAPNGGMVKNPMLSHMERNADWTEPKAGQQLDSSSVSGGSEGSSDISGHVNDDVSFGGDDLNTLEMDHFQYAESHHLELTDDTNAADQLSTLNRESLEELNDLDHAEAVLNIFQDMLDQAEREEQLQLQAIDWRIEMGSLPSLESAAPSIDSLSDHEDDFSEDGKALFEFMGILLDEYEKGLKLRKAKTVFELFQWSEKKNVDDVFEPKKEERKNTNGVIMAKEDPYGIGRLSNPFPTPSLFAVSTDSIESNHLVNGSDGLEIQSSSSWDKVNIEQRVMSNRSVSIQDGKQNLEGKMTGRQIIHDGEWQTPTIAVTTSASESDVTAGRRSILNLSSEQLSSVQAHDDLVEPRLVKVHSRGAEASSKIPKFSIRQTTKGATLNNVATASSSHITMDPMNQDSEPVLSRQINRRSSFATSKPRESRKVEIKDHESNSIQRGQPFQPVELSKKVKTQDSSMDLTNESLHRELEVEWRKHDDSKEDLNFKAKLLSCRKIQNVLVETNAIKKPTKQQPKLNISQYNEKCENHQMKSQPSATQKGLDVLMLRKLNLDMTQTDPKARVSKIGTATWDQDLSLAAKESKLNAFKIKPQSIFLKSMLPSSPTTFNKQSENETVEVKELTSKTTEYECLSADGQSQPAPAIAPKTIESSIEPKRNEQDSKPSSSISLTAEKRRAQLRLRLAKMDSLLFGADSKSGKGEKLENLNLQKTPKIDLNLDPLKIMPLSKASKPAIATNVKSGKRGSENDEAIQPIIEGFLRNEISSQPAAVKKESPLQSGININNSTKLIISKTVKDMMGLKQGGRSEEVNTAQDSSASKEVLREPFSIAKESSLKRKVRKRIDHKARNFIMEDKVGQKQTQHRNGLLASLYNTASTDKTKLETITKESQGSRIYDSEEVSHVSCAIEHELRESNDMCCPEQVKGPKNNGVYDLTEPDHFKHSRKRNSAANEVQGNFSLEMEEESLDPIFLLVAAKESMELKEKNIKKCKTLERALTADESLHSRNEAKKQSGFRDGPNVADFTSHSRATQSSKEHKKSKRKIEATDISSNAQIRKNDSLVKIRKDAITSDYQRAITSPPTIESNEVTHESDSKKAMSSKPSSVSKEKRVVAETQRSRASSVPQAMVRPLLHDDKSQTASLDEDNPSSSTQGRSISPNNIGSAAKYRSVKSNLTTRSIASRSSSHRTPTRQNSEDSIDVSPPIFRKAPSRKTNNNTHSRNIQE